MRYTQHKAFEKHLRSSSPSNFSSLYCLVIKDPGERLLALESLKRTVGVTPLTLHSEEELLSQLDSFSFFSGKQVFHYYCEKFSKSTQLEKRFSHISPDVILVLSTESQSRQSAFYKAVEKHGVLLDTAEEKPWEKEKNLTEWLMERVFQANKMMDLEAAHLLSKGSSGSFARLAVEWEKLLTYVGEKQRISLQDVTTICCLSPLDSTWAFGELLLAQKAGAALEVALRMIDQGGAVFPILRQLRHQMMTALQLTLCDREHIALKFPYLKGQMLEKQLQAGQSFGTSRLIRAIQIIDDFEFKAKDAWDDPKLLLTLLCSRIL